jgi:hypothetical protein
MWYDIKDPFVQAGEIAAKEVKRLQQKQNWINEVNTYGKIVVSRIHPDRKYVHYKLYIWCWSEMFLEYQKLCHEAQAKTFKIILGEN